MMALVVLFYGSLNEIQLSLSQSSFLKVLTLIHVSLRLICLLLINLFDFIVIEYHLETLLPIIWLASRISPLGINLKIRWLTLVVSEGEKPLLSILLLLSRLISVPFVVFNDSVEEQTKCAVIIQKFESLYSARRLIFDWSSTSSITNTTTTSLHPVQGVSLALLDRGHIIVIIVFFDKL